jgi:hypothetical protein
MDSTEAPAERQNTETGERGPAEPVRVIAEGGLVHQLALSADRHAALFHRLLYRGGRGFVEVAAGRRTSDGSLRFRSRSAPENYVPASRPRVFCAQVANRREEGLEVFAAPALRDRLEPGKRAVEAGQVVWVDIDRPDKVERLRAFAHRPHLVVASGGSGGLHAYWRLARPLAGEALESANRRLAHQLGADQASTDRGRIMRVPGTVNGKTGAWCRVTLADLRRPPYEAAALLRDLPDPRPPAPPRVRRSGGGPVARDEVAEVPPPIYFERLTGTPVPEGGGYVTCPFHEERTPSCHVWAEPGRGWASFCCGKGGGPYDLASLLEGGPSGRALRGRDFVAARRSVLERLRPVAA